MNQKLKKQIVKNVAVLFSAATFLTNTPHTFAWKFFPTAKNILYGIMISSEKKQQLNERISHIIHDNLSYDENQINEIKSLLEEGADVNATDASNNTPLIYAAAHSSLDLCQLLIDYGAKVNTTDLCGMTPLHALLNGSYNRNIIHQENTNDLFNLCELLINSDPTILNALDQHGFSPIAYINTGTSLFNFLLSKRAKILKHEKEYICSGNKQIINPTTLTEKERNDLTSHLFQIIEKNGMTEKLKIIKQLVTQGADVHDTSSGYTTLYSAVVNNNTLDVIQFLLDIKVNPNVQCGKKGMTILHHLVETDPNENINIIKLLLKYNADLNIKNKDGYTVLDIACDEYSDYTELMDLLQEHDAKRGYEIQ